MSPVNHIKGVPMGPLHMHPLRNFLWQFLEARRFLFLPRLSINLLALFLVIGILPLSSHSAEASSEAGITYSNEKVNSEPWSIHTIKIDRSRKDLAFFAPHARGRVLAVSLLTEQARSIPAEIGKPIAGVNGDFY